MSEEMSDDLWIDLSWLKGEVRWIVFKEIQKIAFNHGWHYRVNYNLGPKDCSSSYVILTHDGLIRLANNYKSLKQMFSSINFREISVNDAINGNYNNITNDKNNATIVPNIGDVVFCNKKFRKIICVNYQNNSIICNDENCYLMNEYKLCREKKSFKFYAGQIVYHKIENKYYMYLSKHTSSDNKSEYACIYDHRRMINESADLNSLVPASLKERYEII